jgi:hypothetical protein
MASINSQLLFLTTSPRTPEKMIPEIELLIEHFNGKPWNPETQASFMKVLRDADFYRGEGVNDPAFSARDRINRAPQSLGFVTLKPIISLTPAGELLLSSKRKDEIFLRQMLKFQIPSPYHKPTKKATTFCVKPYLEMLRLVRALGTLKFDELQMFGMQLTDYHNFDEIVHKIEIFRIAKAENTGNYRIFKQTYLNNELTHIFQDRIARGETKTRESNDRSLRKFLMTQSRNMRDYADACFRYLRATGLVAVSHVGKSLSIVPERIADVDYILGTVSRDPVSFSTKSSYVAYLGDATTPKLLTDDKELLVNKIRTEFPAAIIPTEASIFQLKDLLFELLENRKKQSLLEQVAEIKDHRLYDDIQNTYNQIVDNELYDGPLMLEWNTWRAMTMLDGGEIKANLTFDDYGKPMSTAQGNMADIECDYGDFELSVEVTLASGQRQYEMESEPVARHLGKLKKTTGKPAYCLFVAPTINEACVSHFYALHRMNILYYGGKSTIVPLPLEVFRKMVEDSYRVTYTPRPNQVKRFFERSNELVEICENEQEWFEQMKYEALNWLSNN